MINEPSVLLIDDDPSDDAYFRMMDLDQKGWAVESAIDQSTNEVIKKAKRKIDEYEGFSIILLDILWPHDHYGGVKVLNKLYRSYGKSIPARQVLIVTKGSIRGDPMLEKLAEKLKVPVDMRTFSLVTETGRSRLANCLSRLWRRIRPQE